MLGHLHEWFEDYLSGRCQRVVIDRVPCVLGPVLFALFINDLPHVLPNTTLAALFADDTKVSIRSEADCEILQHALTSLGSWSADNNFNFNQSKCKVLTITRKKTPLVYAYHMGSKDVVCAKFKWDVHTHTIIGKANRMLGLLKRTCPLLTNNSVWRALYLTHVRSQLCYASEVWSPNTVQLRTRVESVQKRATVWILNSNHGVTYQQRVKDWYVSTYSHSATRERFLTWCSSSRHFMTAQIWTLTPLSPLPAMVGPGSVKILRSSLKFPSVNQTRSKHPTSTELLNYGTISVKFNILLPSVLSPRLKGTFEICIKTCLGQYLT